MYFVYILRSKKLNKNYIGFTKDLKTRFKEHKSGFSKYTKKANDWILIYIEVYANRKDALRRERKLKYYGNAYVGLKRRLVNTFIDFEGGNQDSQ